MTLRAARKNYDFKDAFVRLDWLFYLTLDKPDYSVFPGVSHIELFASQKNKQ